MSKKKREKRPLLTSSVLDANDDLREKYGERAISTAQAELSKNKVVVSMALSETENTAPVFGAAAATNTTAQPLDDEDSYVTNRAEKVINVVSRLLTMLLLGGSLVFWWVVLKYLLFSPYSLADPVQMETLLSCCATVPVIVAAGQAALRRPVDSERWLICMCISGVLTTIFVVFLQMVLRESAMTLSDVPTLLCCAVSGCALPSVIFYGLRIIVGRLRASIDAERRADWLTVRRDVLELTDFETLR